MTAKMEEAFRSEQQARQLAQSEIMKRLKDEENARQMVRKDFEGLSVEMNSLQRGSGSTVCSEASTGVWETPAPLLGPQLLPPGSVTSSFQERWNLKDGSRTRNSVATGAHGHRGFEFHQRPPKDAA